jgi:hypothetical protein
MKYKLVGGNTAIALEQVVQMYLDDGWRPIGSPFFTPGQYYQAVTLEEKKETA